MDFGIDEMQKMQIKLQNKYKDKWESICPETGKNKLLWMIGEIGEVIDIVKKNGFFFFFSDTHLRKAVDVMLKKHPTCRWRSEKIRSKKYFILIEGYEWLKRVYFQKEKSLIDADVDFFETRIKLYEEFLKLEHNENWWYDDMNIRQLCNYFNRKDITVRKAIKEMCDSGFKKYKLLINNKVVISKEAVEWICKNVFKQKYLELLEKYKMELTEKYIKSRLHI